MSDRERSCFPAISNPNIKPTTLNVIYMLACDVDGIDNILYAIDTGHKRDRYISIFIGDYKPTQLHNACTNFDIDPGRTG
jgi:hypothetical protein